MRRAHLTAALAPLLLAAMAPAQASISFEGGGDLAVAPLYRAFAFVMPGLNRQGETPPPPSEGIDYTSNVVPRGFAGASIATTYHGASVAMASGSAYSGFYAGRNWASMQIANANPGDTYYAVAGQGSTTTVRFYDPTAQAQSAVFHWHVSGTTAGAPTTGWNGSFGATGRLDFYATTEAGRSWANLFYDADGKGTWLGNGSLSVFGPGEYTFTLPIAALGQDTFLYYWSAAFTQINAGSSTAGANYNLRADYWNTFDITSVDLLDANGAAVDPGWSMVDAVSGDTLFDATGRVAPLDAAPPSPTLPELPELPALAVDEPTPTALLAAAFIGLTGLGRRRRRRHD